MCFCDIIYSFEKGLKSKMIRIAVCDDNTMYSKDLIRDIRAICAVKVPEQYDCQGHEGFQSAEDVISYLEKNKIDILFLDIEMKGMNGFELASILNQKFPDIIIIFVSAFENYVYSAFEYAPFRFLRKTHIDDELEDALLAAIDKLMSIQKTMVFDTIDGKIELRLVDILYIESERNYLIIHQTGGNTYRVRSTLSEMLDKIEEYDFCRIHNAFVINLSNIRRTEGNKSVTMKDGTNLPISARKSVDFKNAYMDFTSRRFIK